MRIHVLLFAQLAEIADRKRLTLELADGTTACEAFEALAQQHAGVADMRGRIAFAINEKYAQDDDALHDGDTLALIPPVSGG